MDVFGGGEAEVIGSGENGLNLNFLFGDGARLSFMRLRAASMVGVEMDLSIWDER